MPNLAFHPEYLWGLLLLYGAWRAPGLARRLIARRTETRHTRAMREANK